MATVIIMPCYVVWYVLVRDASLMIKIARRHDLYLNYSVHVAGLHAGLIEVKFVDVDSCGGSTVVYNC